MLFHTHPWLSHVPWVHPSICLPTSAAPGQERRRRSAPYQRPGTRDETIQSSISSDLHPSQIYSYVFVAIVSSTHHPHPQTPFPQHTTPHPSRHTFARTFSAKPSPRTLSQAKLTVSQSAKLSDSSNPVCVSASVYVRACACLCVYGWVWVVGSLEPPFNWILLQQNSLNSVFVCAFVVCS